jgi:hypothetical protein
MEIAQILEMIILHWIADFLSQSRKVARAKSSSNKALLEHTWIYSGIFALALIPYSIRFVDGTLVEIAGKILAFFLITFVCHTITDYYSSRCTNRYYKENKESSFWNMIGFDQALHHIQLVLTFNYLYN